MFEIFAFVYFVFLILFAFSMIIHKKQGEINKIHQDLLEGFYKRLKFLEQKQTEMRANYCLLVRRVDNIFKDEIFITRDDFLEALKTISEDFEKMSGEIEKIDEYQKQQNRRLKVLEANDNHICKGNWEFEKNEKIFK